MNLSNNNTNLDEENWQLIELSKVTDKIIKQLVENLNKNLSENFYISFESLLKIGKKAKSIIVDELNELEETHNFRKDMLKYLLTIIEDKELNLPLVSQLYHPDFIIRARTLMRINENYDNKYLKFVLPLLGDPDDSVRWALINLIEEQNVYQEPYVEDKLNKRLKKEPNGVIRKKIKKLILK
ncbi:MAG: hypothetical protein GF383_04620 [Candidatus Lokiarchaeota archaeon]|nr:hypothetical protein [Candidatus Lokiarchaeota archaeon]MBD3339069.1 hypothetical protein [Candidatus Lokiarchaeota archaeon]